MTQKDYDKLCEQFELGKELEKMDLERELEVKRSLFFYVGSEQTVKKIRKQWEDTKQKDFEKELAYRNPRREKELFGPQGKAGAKERIEELEEPQAIMERIADGFKSFFAALASPFYWLTKRLNTEKAR